MRNRPITTTSAPIPPDFASLSADTRIEILWSRQAHERQLTHIEQDKRSRHKMHADALMVSTCIILTVVFARETWLTEWASITVSQSPLLIQVIIDRIRG